jgi:predicted RecA/RadA family phage recombinase
MKNAIQANGDTLVVTSGGAIAAGAGVLNGSLFGVAMNSAAGAGERVTLALRGVYELPKVGSQAWTVGAPIYWTGTACTTTAGTNKMIGWAWEAVGAGPGETLGKVCLNGAVVTP